MKTADHFQNANIPTSNALHSFFEENPILLLFQPISQILNSFKFKVSVMLETQKGRI